MFEELFSASGLSLERMRSFLHVAESGSITRAAAGDAVRQSQYSRQIRELEAFFGAELTRRRGKTLALSEQGLRLAAIIRHELQSLDDFRREMRAQPRIVSIGASSSVLDWLVVPAFPGLQKVLPGCRWKMEACRTQELVQRVADGRLDFAVVRQDAVSAGQPKRKVASLNYVAAVPSGMARRFASKDKLSLADLASLPLAVPTTEGQFYAVLEKAFMDAQSSLQSVVECQSFLQVKALVEAGACAAVVPSIAPVAKAAKFELPQLGNYRRTVVLHWNQRQMERRGMGRALIDQLAATLAGR